ncbi:MAG: cytochrome P450 [Pseudomonadota bacterium]
MSEEAVQNLVIPDHVPTKLVRDFDPTYLPGMDKCPFSAVSKLHDDARVVWTGNSMRFGGSWIITHAEDIRYVLSHPDLFSATGQTGFSRLLGEDWPLLPLEANPPEHTDYRKLLNPLLAPPAVAKLEPKIRQRASDLIDAFRNDGQCEFMSVFGRPYPVTIILELLGLPLDKMDQFLKWEFELLHSKDPATMAGAAKAIKEYLESLRTERQANPSDDIVSQVVNAEIDGRRLNDDETLGILYLFFVGGLDTVASSLGFIFRHLAENPDHQAFLRENPDRIPGAIEEYLRRFSVVTVYRQCREDTSIGGIAMKKGDWITIVTALGSLDAAEFKCPMDVDFGRKNIRHFGLSTGVHFCLGNHLARRELKIALEEWLARVPSWRLKDGELLDVHGGPVFGVEHMVLGWR